MVSSGLDLAQDEGYDLGTVLNGAVLVKGLVIDWMRDSGHIIGLIF